MPTDLDDEANSLSSDAIEHSNRTLLGNNNTVFRDQVGVHTCTLKATFYSFSESYRFQLTVSMCAAS